MPSTPPLSLPVALESLRGPIESFAATRPSDESFKGSMLGLADQLEDLWSQEEDETLESDILWTALHAFPALTISGPPPEELVELALTGSLMDQETIDTLRTVTRIRRTLRALEPPGFAAALWRSALLAIYGMIELFVLLDDDRGTDQCFALLDTAEAMADKFSGEA